MGDARTNPAAVQQELPFDSVIVVSPAEIVPVIQRTKHESIQVSLDRLAAQGYFVVKRKQT